jgi:protein SCO1/2
MNPNSLKKSVLTLVVFAVFSVGMIYAIYTFLVPDKKLQVYNPTDVNPRLVDKSIFHIRKNHRVSDFNLINQNGDTITQKNYEDKIYVVDFFFTRCQTICPIMTNNIVKIQEVFKNDNDIMFLSLSVTPELDSVSVLRAYADQKGIMDTKWNITTGNKKHIYELARKSFFTVKDTGDGGLQDFIHTENFVLVDKKRQIRGYYDGTDDVEMDQLVEDIELLMN